MHDVRTLFLEHHVNTCQQLATDGAQHCAMMLAFGALASIKSLQFGFVADRHTGRLPQCLAQVRRTTLTHVHVVSFKLPTLMHTGIDAGVSYQLFLVAKAGDITDLSQDHGARD